ncbi:Steroid reductase [Phaffia rhodozyma]|uniref:Steroid reductase n=1 Tax=Phaffia rhodozyma TaxID=264483 RepID=A0A0F7SMF4_PHARH|nr:Steroid reductase [Phaffia rhodozyma]
MELVSPVALLMALEPKMGWSSKVDPIRVLTGLYMAHYLNRSIVSVLRSRQMAPMHLIVWLSAVVFNSINGSLIGTFLRVQSQSCMSTSRWFWLGVSIWALGWVSNIAHDEILMNLRRDSSGTSMASSSRHSYRTADGRLYSIPWGGLFRWVSFPSYLSELIEWTGFGLACASVGCQTDLSEIFLNLFQSEETFQVSGWDVPLLNPASLFVMNEVGVYEFI